ncbi:hypothetical protein ACC695_39740, partial [Rhizobium ruizarguesonis]
MCIPCPLSFSIRIVARNIAAIELVKQSLAQYGGVVYLNVKRLTHIKMTAFAALSDILTASCRARPERKIVI